MTLLSDSEFIRSKYESSVINGKNLVITLLIEFSLIDKPSITTTLNPLSLFLSGFSGFA